MDVQRWMKIEEVFQAALDLAPEARREFVNGECGGNDEMCREVNKLVARYEAEEEFLESPVWTDSRLFQSEARRGIASALEKEIKVDEKKKSRVGQRVGAYQLVEEIGVGGMGVVYLGERADGEFSQKVAIKLIKRGMDTDFIIKRFRHERQILAAFSHPNIARLFDGGTTPDGSPFFAMEYIEGSPLFKYCEKNHLDIRGRLKIFREVCAAVSYAHSRHIIHRDIKPGNVLVTKEGEPKLLDFGIAKILDPDLIHESMMPTATQMRLMTPEYASPEQVCGHEVSPASDQYSLGVVLYELVTGGRPYRFPSRAPHEIARIICEEEPKSPAVAAIEAKRGANNGEAENEITLPDREDLIGEDLERIILKSLRKEPEERYASIAEFSADIERYLKDEPIRFGAATRKEGKTIKPPAAPASETQKSIAVLPFNVLDTTSAGDTGDAKFLSFGLTDSLIARLSKIRQFIVRPTSSVMRYAAPRELDSFAIGRELGVEFVLEGNVIKTDSKIRVSVQLLRVADGAVIWADRFDESSADVLVLEDAISLKVAEALIPQLTTKEIKNLAKRGTDNAEAHEAYLRGRFHWNTFTEEGFRQSILFYRKSVELDPNYAQAYAGIADYFMWLGIFGVLSPEQSYQPAIANGRRAIEIDDELAEGYAALGFAQLCGDFDWQTSEANIRRAIELNPNYAVAHNWLAIILYTAARFDEGISHAERAVELDPLTYQNYRTLSWGFYFSRRFDEALVVIEETIEKFPMFGVAYFNQSWAQRASGKALEGLNSSARAMELSGGNVFVLLGHAQALAAAGKLREAEKLIEIFRRQNPARYVSYYQIALIYAHAGANEKSLEALDRAMIDREGWLVWLAVEPALDLLRREPRFIRMIEEIQPPAAIVENRKAGERIGKKFSENVGNKINDNAGDKISERITGAETTNGKPASPIVKSSIKSEEAKLQSSLQPLNNKQKSIAVLPFKMLNPAVEDSTDEDAFMSLGLADALITRLSNVQRFIVRPTSSVLPYAGNDKIDSFAAARELNVNFLLEGNILRIGRRIRVSTQLLDASQGSTVWAERFDEDFTDVMSLEDVLSARVAASLVPQLSQVEAQNLAKRLTSEPAAYEAYMRGRVAWNLFTEDGFRRSIDYYRQAIRLDPNFAVAHAAIADYYVWLGMYGLMPSEEFYPPARKAAERAVELDPKSSEAYAALGLMELYGKYDWKTSEKHLRHAIELNPHNSVAHLWFQHTLFSQRRFEEGTKHLDRTLELDPLTFQNHNTYAWGLYFRRRFDDALAKAREMVDRFPGTSYPYFGICAFSSAAGNAEDALWAAEKMAGISNDSLFTVLAPAQALAVSGRREEAIEVVENPHLPRLAFYHKAVVYCYLKDKERVFALLEKAFANRESALIWVGIEPSYDLVRDDPKYQSLLERMNHPLAAMATASIKKAAGAFELAPSLFASTPAPAIKAAPINKTAAPVGQNIAADFESISTSATEKSAIPAVAKYIFAVLVIVALAVGLYFFGSR